MTQAELLQVARDGRPNVRYAASRKGDAIGAWNESLGRFQCVAAVLITGQWASMPYELLVNGQPVYAAGDWVEATT